MNDDTHKLTKKQKKSLAFRERGKKGKGKISNADLAVNDVPIQENQDFALAEVSAGDAEGKEMSERVSGKDGKSGSRKRTEKEREKDTVSDATKTRKRKRNDDWDTQLDVEMEVESPGTSIKGALVGNHKRRKSKPGGDVDEEEDNAKSPMMQRYILFVGNLKYTTTMEAIQKHFEVCNPAPTVRLLTPKLSPSSKQPTKARSKGCAFLEFNQHSGLQRALRLHHSELDGRKINVELTAGGGGKGESRIAKLQERNKGLDDQRRKHSEKARKHDPNTPELFSRPQRYSSTSGVYQVPQKKRTWTVGDVDDGQSHRGGKKHTKWAKKIKNLGTGVNAIPLG